MIDDAWEAMALQVAALSGEEFADRFEALEHQQDRDEALRLRWRHDLLGFARWCWPDLFSMPWNDFHRAELAKPLPRWEDRIGSDVRDAVAAPRGVAKTTTAKARVVHALAYGLDPYVVVLSAEQRLALAISDHLRQMVSDKDSEFARLYGPVSVEGSSGEWIARWSGRRISGVLARSFGTQIRGANLRAQRPTLIVVDDGERPDRVRSADQREIWNRFLADDVQKSGPREGGLAILWRGTVLHSDSVLSRLLANPGWSGGRWKALISWPDRADLWEECRAIWADLTRGDASARRAAAYEFYEAHRADMDRGAEVLDEVAEPLFRLYEYIWSDGLASFLREKQNEPRDPAAAIFDSASFTRCKVTKRNGEWVIVTDGGGRIVPLSGCRMMIRWDPSLGDPTSDDAALSLVAADSHGYGYVVAAWVAKRKPSIQLAALWEMAERFEVKRASLEGNGFQRLIGNDFRRQRNERREAKRYWQVELDEDPSTTNKEERIGGLEPAITNGWLQFAEGLPQAFLSQWDDFPDTSGGHDLDGPDATEGAYARVGAAPRAADYKKKRLR